ncbi:MAG: ATP-binding protein, partial [Armatimonadota bacterium]
RLAEIGQMTAAIAHEIRNPLTGIRSAAQAVRQHPELADDLLGLIDEEVTKLNLLCEDFLEFARPLHVELRPTRLAEVTNKVVHLLKPDFQAAGVNLELRIERDDSPVQADSRRVEQVLHNLLRNALRATSKGKNVKVSVSGPVVVVEDEGTGMDDQEVARLFSPFFTTKANGTGLGLCNVRKIVDAHSGTIGVESRLGQGSRFTVEFSRRKE